uniref:Uncharacterized protein n=1 Tax=Arundo donax TaxID=35708 RepID=A0A0A9CAG1_ARUDO
MNYLTNLLLPISVTTCIAKYVAASTNHIVYTKQPLP